ncbi:MAG: sodium ion-translocating decarboxylase subunit beta [Bacillota bacterium]
MEFSFFGIIGRILSDSGFAALIDEPRYLIMILISFLLLYCGIVKKFEPLLLVPIAFGVLMANFPNTGILEQGGLFKYFYYGIEYAIYPSIVFMGIGAMTDFGPLIARPSSLLLGAAAQLGVFAAFLMALMLGFEPSVAAAIGIIGGADGPTAILAASKLAVAYLPAIAIAAYSYMALIPMIQPPVINLLTTKEERSIKMEQLRVVSKAEKIIFPVAVASFVILLIPDTAPLVGMLMLGNLFKECMVTDRLSDTAQNTLINIVTILLGLSVGSKAAAENFLTVETIKIIVLGLVAFMLSTMGGLVLGKVMCKVSGGKINPLLGSAGVSAVPMASRIAQIEGQKANPSNFLLMHAMGPNVAGVIGSAVAAGFLIKVFG